MRVSGRLLPPIAVLGVVLAAGCAARSVRISELKNQPDRYEGKTISVTGTVTNAFGIPLVPFQLYNVDDGTGEITVVSRATRSPSSAADRLACTSRKTAARSGNAIGS